MAQFPRAFSDIRKARRAAGLTLDALAQRVGLSVPHLSMVERGRARLSVDAQRRIEAELGIGEADDIEDFIGALVAIHDQ